MVRLVGPGSSEKWRDMGSPYQWPKIDGYAGIPVVISPYKKKGGPFHPIHNWIPG